MISSAWDRCDEPPVKLEIVRGRHGKWLVRTVCRCRGAAVYHTKRSNFVFKRRKNRAPTRCQREGLSKRKENRYETPTLTPPSRLMQIQPTHNKEFSVKKSEVFPSRFWKAADLKGGRMTVKISEVVMESIVDDEDDKPCVYFENQTKCLPLNVTNWNMLEELSGSDESDNWVGLRVSLYATKVDFQGKRVPAIRIEAAPVSRQAGGGGTGSRVQKPLEPDNPEADAGESDPDAEADAEGFPWEKKEVSGGK
jgi:hypothetical protein